MELEQIALEDDYFVEPQALPERRLLLGHRPARASAFPTAMFTAHLRARPHRGLDRPVERDDRATRSQKIGRPRQLFTGPVRARRDADRPALDLRGRPFVAGPSFPTPRLRPRVCNPSVPALIRQRRSHPETYNAATR
jgi:hypothetical protein